MCFVFDGSFFKFPFLAEIGIYLKIILVIILGTLSSCCFYIKDQVYGKAQFLHGTKRAKRYSARNVMAFCIAKL